MSTCVGECSPSPPVSLQQTSLTSFHPLPRISEEENDLPKFEAAISRDDSIAMAKKFSLTKNIVPTRAHPSVPDNGGLFQTAAGLALVS